VTAHLTDAVIRQYVSGKLGSSDLLAVDDHLAECQACRDRAALLGSVGQRLEAASGALLPVDSHLSDEEVQRYVGGELTAEDRSRIDAHLEACNVCAAQIDDLWAFVSAQPGAESANVATRAAHAADPARATHVAQVTHKKRATRATDTAWLWFAAAAAVLLAVTASAIVWQQATDEPDTIAAIPGFTALPVDRQTHVRAAIEAGVAQPPPIVTELAGGRDVLMGSAPVRQPFELIAPVATTVVSDRPSLSWHALDRGATPSGPQAPAIDGNAAPNTTYTVTIVDDRLQPIATSPPLTAPRWDVQQPLARGRTYAWQVAAHRGNDAVVVPSAPAPPAKFAVLDAETEGFLRRMEADYPTSHLLLGMLYLEAGVLADARRHFAAVPASDPNIAIAQRSLARIDRLASGSR
jgi:anti-sigma factor RsiW